MGMNTSFGHGKKNKNGPFRQMNDHKGQEKTKKGLFFPGNILTDKL